MKNNHEIVETVKALMDKNNINISELARRVNSSRASLYRYLNEERTFPVKRVDSYAMALNTTPENLLGMNNDIPSDLMQISSFKKIPVLGTIACGEPILADENIIDYEYLPADSVPYGEIFFLKCKGDSMQPLINDGSLVMIKHQPFVENGEIAAVLLDGSNETTLKRVRYQDNSIILIAENPKYPPYLINENNPGRILGKAVQTVNKL